MFEGLKDKFEGFGSGLGGGIGTLDEAEKRKMLGQFLMAGLGSGSPLGVGVGLLGGLMAKHAGKREGEIEDALSMGPPSWMKNA